MMPLLILPRCPTSALSGLFGPGQGSAESSGGEPGLRRWHNSRCSLRRRGMTSKRSRAALHLTLSIKLSTRWMPRLFAIIPVRRKKLWRAHARSSPSTAQELPAYRVPEAAHYLGLPQSTVRYWSAIVSEGIGIACSPITFLEWYIYFTCATVSAHIDTEGLHGFDS